MVPGSSRRVVITSSTASCPTRMRRALFGPSPRHPCDGVLDGSAGRPGRCHEFGTGHGDRAFAVEYVHALAQVPDHVFVAVHGRGIQGVVVARQEDDGARNAGEGLGRP